MKNKFTLCAVAAVLIVSGLACNMSTANLSSLTVSKDADGKQAATSFKAGETIYANAVVSNAPGATTVKMYLTAEDIPGTKKGETLAGSEVKIALPSSGTAKYSLKTPAEMQGGKLTLVADMLDDKGEKKDSKSSAITLEGSSAPASAPAPAKSDDKSADDDDN